jgi:hypothetical protein
MKNKSGSGSKAGFIIKSLLIWEGEKRAELNSFQFKHYVIFIVKPPLERGFTILLLLNRVEKCNFYRYIPTSTQLHYQISSPHTKAKAKI